MKLFLIRHAQCAQNVGQASASDGDSGLTDGGKTQVQLLAQHFRGRVIRFTRVFSSDLDRACRTAKGICQQQLGGGPLVPVETPALREQQFSSSLEGTRWRSGAPASSTGSPDGLQGGEPDYTQEESLESMKARVNGFLREHILPLMVDRAGSEEVVAVIAHGVILQVLWVCLVDLFDPRDIYFGPGVNQDSLGDTITPVWSNTGYVELDIKPRPPDPQVVSGGPAPPLMITGTILPPHRESASGAPLSGWSITVLAIDETSHLANAQLGRTGGTVRNAVHDMRQQSMDEFYRLTGTA